MKNLRYILPLILLIFTAFASSAQQPQPVVWRVQVKMTSATEGVATIKAVVEPGWHLYGLDIPKGGPKPTVFDFSESAGLKLIGKPVPDQPAAKSVDPIFNMTISQWDADVKFKQKFKVTDAAKFRFAGTIQFQACNGQTCTRPSTYNFSKHLPNKK